jgi:hypothetical protein
VKKVIYYIFLFVSTAAYAQKPLNKVDSVQLSNLRSPGRSLSIHQEKKRQWLIGGATVAGYGGSFIFLNEAWYKGYPRSGFHTFDDIGEWKQIDKTGHAWTAYNTSRVTTSLWEWAGVDHNTSVLLASSTSLLYMLSIEYLDGRSAEWGWSWPDAGADLIGTSLYAAQEWIWKEQKVNLKFSSHYKQYSPASLHQRADDLFGKSLPERLLKDYNAQTYWLSFNLRALGADKWPNWLNVAIGYGAEGMFGGYENIAYDKAGAVIFDRRDIKRYRQWYLSPDIDLTRIKTKSKFLRSAFSVLNILKIPAPAVEVANGKVKLHGLMF